MHRDLKPENILVSDIDLPKKKVYIMLTDFGFACHSGQEDDLKVGTIYFQAPEIINQNHPCTNKVDIWAAGCIAYYLLSGLAYPFDSDAEDE